VGVRERIVVCFGERSTNRQDGTSASSSSRPRRCLALHKSDVLRMAIPLQSLP